MSPIQKPLASTEDAATAQAVNSRQDHAEALHWFRKADGQGYASAQNNIGWMYYNGLGVPQDYVKAAFWYRKAADQGNALAQNNLGLLYQNGLGVPQDKVQTRAWMQKAAAAGNADAKKWRGNWAVS